MLNHIIKALRGRSYWFQIKRKYKIEKNNLFVILMTEHDNELNLHALRYLDLFIQSRFINGVVILTNDFYVSEEAKKYIKKILHIEYINEKEVELLYKFYTLYRFSDRFINISLDKPIGNTSFMTLGSNGITKEDLVCLGMYCFRTMPKKPEVSNA